MASASSTLMVREPSGLELVLPAASRTKLPAASTRSRACKHPGLARLATSAVKAERQRQIANAWQRVADARRRRVGAMVEASWAEQA